jgi:23S rRNA pseudouridine2605 synthase
VSSRAPRPPRERRRGSSAAEDQLATSPVTLTEPTEHPTEHFTRSQVPRKNAGRPTRPHDAPAGATPRVRRRERPSPRRRAAPPRGQGPRATATRASSTTPEPTLVSIARALSKLGVCSRAEGERLVAAGRVRVDGRIVRELGRRVHPERDVIEVDGARVGRAERVYLALNKLRGHVTTRDDPQGRPTVYASLGRATLPFVAPVGRLDRASEGLLLLTNDSQWAARLLDPAAHVDKTYHVQVRAVADEALIARVAAGVTEPSSGERLAVKAVTVLRVGSRSSAWLEIVLDEGRNRHIRRLLHALDVEVLRLVRVAIGPLTLGELPKGDVAAADARRGAGAVAPAVTGRAGAREPTESGVHGRRRGFGHAASARVAGAPGPRRRGRRDDAEEPAGAPRLGRLSGRARAPPPLHGRRARRAPRRGAARR